VSGFRLYLEARSKKMTVNTTERALERPLNYRPSFLKTAIVGPRYEIFNGEVDFSYDVVASGDNFLDTIETHSESLIYVLDPGFPDLSLLNPIGKYLLFGNGLRKVIINYDHANQLLYLDSPVFTNDWPHSANPAVSEPIIATWEIRDLAIPDTVDFYYHHEALTYKHQVPPYNNGEGYIESTEQMKFGFWDVPSYTPQPLDEIIFFTGRRHRVLFKSSNKIVFDSPELDNHDIDTFFEIQRSGVVVCYGNHAQLAGIYESEFYLVDSLGIPTIDCPKMIEGEVIYFANHKSRFYKGGFLDQAYENTCDGKFVDYWEIVRFSSEFLELYNYNSRTYRLTLPHENPEDLTITVGDGLSVIYERPKDYTTRYLVTDKWLIDETADFKDVEPGDTVWMPMVNLTFSRETINDGRTFVVEKTVINKLGKYTKIIFKKHTLDYADREWVGNYRVMSGRESTPIFIQENGIFVNIEDKYINSTKLKIRYKVLSPGGLTEVFSDDEVTVDELNPVGLAVSLALKSSQGYPIYYYPIHSNDENGYVEALKHLNDMYCLVPLTQDQRIIEIFHEHVELMSKEYKYQIVLLNHELVDTVIVITDKNGELAETIIED